MQQCNLPHGVVRESSLRNPSSRLFPRPRRRPHRPTDPTDALGHPDLHAPGHRRRLVDDGTTRGPTDQSSEGRRPTAGRTRFHLPFRRHDRGRSLGGGGGIRQHDLGAYRRPVRTHDNQGVPPGHRRQLSRHHHHRGPSRIHPNLQPWGREDPGIHQRGDHRTKDRSDLRRAQGPGGRHRATGEGRPCGELHDQLPDQRRRPSKRHDHPLPSHRPRRHSDGHAGNQQGSHRRATAPGPAPSVETPGSAGTGPHRDSAFHQEHVERHEGRILHGEAGLRQG